ncbi:hypothetical protein QZH41_015072 [Actinostola sp. cb2023]|nr:hypothetical protein QZH41_015072 [Actinostola sp. cb2023]
MCIVNLVCIVCVYGTCITYLYCMIKVDDNGKIIEAKFKTFGCGSAIASSSLATEWIKGKSVVDLLTVETEDDILDETVEPDLGPPTDNPIDDTVYDGSTDMSSFLPVGEHQQQELDAVAEAIGIKNTDIAKELSLPPVKLHCSSRVSLHQ